jgi:ubiquinone/menaquinone biosynthesis C-methylase UbiE
VTERPRDEGGGAYGEAIREHYRKEAESFGTDPASTMRDEITRGREVDAVLSLAAYLQSTTPVRHLLEIGPGNGYLLAALRDRVPDVELSGLEYSPEMLELARGRSIERCELVEGDVKAMPFADGGFDLVVSERCLINLMDRADQELALAEVARVLRAGGHYLCIEAFTDGLANLNRAREELGLPPHDQPHHNLWLDKDWFLEVADRYFVEHRLEAAPLPPRNFLSSHYFVSRVLYPAVTRREVLYNTEFVKFLSFLPPIGDYSPIQLYVLEKRA